MLEIQITVDGSEFYISDEAHYGADFGSASGSVFYYPFLAQAPSVKLASTEGGYVRCESGTLALLNQPFNSDHPFSGTRYRNLLDEFGTPSTPIEIAIKDGTKYAIFEGTLYPKRISDQIIEFDILEESLEFYLADGVATNSSGQSQTIPWPFGRIYHVDGLVYKGSENWAMGTTTHPGFNCNPIFPPSNFIGISSVSTAFYAIGAGTLTTLTATQFSGGSATPAYNDDDVATFPVGLGPYGTKRNGDPNSTSDKTDTFEDLLEYIAEDIGLTVATDIDTTKVASAALLSKKCSLWETEKILSVDVLSKVLPSYNCLFTLRRNQSNGRKTLYLIEREYQGTAVELSPDEIVSVSLRNNQLKFVKYISSPLRFFNDVLKRSNYEAYSYNASSGREITLQFYHYNSWLFSPQAEQATLDSIRDIEKKPKVTVKLQGIRPNYQIGDRFTFNRKESQTRTDMMVREITWDWRDQTTTIAGDCDISIIETS